MQTNRTSLPRFGAALLLAVPLCAQTASPPPLLRADLPTRAAFCLRWPGGLPANSPIAALAQEPDVAALLQRADTLLHSTWERMADTARLEQRLQGHAGDPLLELMLRRFLDLDTIACGYLSLPPQPLRVGCTFALTGDALDPDLLVQTVQQSQLSEGTTALTACGRRGISRTDSQNQSTWLLASTPFVAGIGAAPEQLLTTDAAAAYAPRLRGPGMQMHIASSAYTREMTAADLDNYRNLGVAELGDMDLDLGWPDGHFEQRFAMHWRLQADSPLAGIVPGHATPPAPALPARPLLQLRGSIDVASCLLACAQIATAEGDPIDVDPQEVSEMLGRMLNGGFTLAVLAPAPGSIFPRAVLSLGVDDPMMLRGALEAEAAQQPDGTWDTRQFAGHRILVARIPGAPAGISPTVCVLDDVVHITESTATMRALLRRLDDKEKPADLDAVAMPLPALQGTPLCELLFDAEGIANTLHRTYGTLLRMNIPSGPGRPLCDADDLPEFEQLTRHLGCGRAAFVCDDTRAEMVEAAPVCGPLWAAALAIAYEMLPNLPVAEPPSLASIYSAVDHRIGELRLQRLGTALQQWRQLHAGQLPGSIADLVPLLPGDDAEPLLVPGDPEPVDLRARDADGVERALRSSFALAATGTMVPVLVRRGASRIEVWCYEAHGTADRLVLATDGTVAHVAADALAAGLRQKR